MTINIDDIKKLREETGAGIVDTKKALEESGGDYDKALDVLKKKGLAKAEKKSERAANDGLVYSYIHGNGKVGSMVFVACETDFVAKTDDFKNLCHELALQVCTTEYSDVSEVLEDDYIRDPSKTVELLIKEVIAKLGENIELRDFTRLSVR